MATASAPAVAVPDLPVSTPHTTVQVMRLARYQLRDYLLSRRFILMIAIVAIIGTILTVLVAHYRPASLLASSDAYYGSAWAGGIGVIIVFAGVIFGGDAIAGEFQNKTGYFLMGLPVRRTTVYIGKYLAAFAAALVSVVAYALILVGNGAYYFGAGAVTLAFVESFLLAVVYLLALLGATFLFSSMFKTSAYAILVVAILFIIGFSILETVVASLANIEPWFIISYASPVIGYPFDAQIPAHIVVTHFGRGMGGGPTITSYNPSYPEGIGIMLGYFVVTSLLGLVIFEREEFT